MNDSDILTTLGLKNPQLLGRGMEGRVYDFSDNKIIKFWDQGYADMPRLQNRKKLYKDIADKISIPVPEIYEINEDGGTVFTIEKKLSGKQGNLVYATLNEQDKQRLLDLYFQILFELKKIKIDSDYGQFLPSSAGRIHSNSWKEFLSQKLDETIQKVKNKPDHDVQNILSLFEKFKNEDLKTIISQPPKTLVHGDLFLENVLFNDNLEISGLLDFSALSVVGDHLIDVAALCYFARVSNEVDKDAENYLLQKSQEIYPQSSATLETYLVYFSLLFINSKSYDPRTYTWCLENLFKLGYLE